jgi:hypothetical protein
VLLAAAVLPTNFSQAAATVAVQAQPLLLYCLRTAVPATLSHVAAVAAVLPQMLLLYCYQY